MSNSVKKRNPMRLLGVRVSEEMSAALDREAELLSAHHHLPLTKSAIVRCAIQRYLAEVQPGAPAKRQKARAA